MLGLWQLDIKTKKIIADNINKIRQQKSEFKVRNLSMIVRF